MTSRKPKHLLWMYLAQLSASVLVAIAVGVFVGYTGWLVGFAAGAHLSWHIVRLKQLNDWLHDPRERPRAAAGKGLWEDTFRVVQKRRTESRERKKRLASLLRELRNASSALPDGIVVLDAEDVIVWANHGADQLLGVKSAHDRGRPLANLVRDLRIVSWLKEAGPERSLTLDSHRQLGQTLRLRVFPYAKDQRLLIARDVTEMAQVDAMRKDFVANVSHELRTPLTVISGYIETMSEEVDADWLPIVERVETQTARMRSIVEDLLTLSRLEAGDNADLSGLVNIQSLINSVLMEGQDLSEDEHEFVINIDADLHLKGSASDLHGAFLNLVTNAIRYTQPGGRIEVSWQRNDEQQAVFSVRDNGPGIAMQHQARLTERFYRVSTDRSRESGGTGLGLAIVKHVLASHDGDLKIDSIPGEGSCFSCIFDPGRIVDQWPATREVS
ncbi:MAG: phosphate regulon sensor histidine kinase PhoR [Lysobacterales bacterium]